METHSFLTTAHNEAMPRKMQSPKKAKPEEAMPNKS
jgi:hypothetical protein